MVEPGPIGGSLWPSPSSSCHVFIWPNKRVLPSRVPDFGTDKNLSTFLAAVKKPMDTVNPIIPLVWLAVSVL